MLSLSPGNIGTPTIDGNRRSVDGLIICGKLDEVEQYVATKERDTLTESIARHDPKRL
jgi:hypothetical protein